MNKLLNKLRYYVMYELGINIYRYNPRPSTVFVKNKFKNKHIRVLEIGAFDGKNAQSLFKQLPNAQYTGVDPYVMDNDYLQSVSGKFKNINDELYWKANNIISQKGILIRLTSNMYFQKHQRMKFDFIYIDGDHRYKQVLKDLFNGWNALKVGGVLAGHDWEKYDVSRAVVEFAQKIGVKPITTKDDFIFVKQEARDVR